MRTLNTLKVGESGIVHSLTGADLATNRLTALAITPGIKIKILGIAPLGDPMMVKASETRFSIRRKDAAQVVIW